METPKKSKLKLEKKVIAVLDENKLKHIVAGGQDNQTISVDLTLPLPFPHPTLSITTPFCISL